MGCHRHTWTARNIFRALRAISGELGADFGRFCAPEFARNADFGRFRALFSLSENRLGRVPLIFRE